jgi:hypothetical protein
MMKALGRTERHGLVTSYDPKKHLAKVALQPSGELSGWLPIEEGHVGNGWGHLVGLTPGTGRGSQTQSISGSGESSSSSGGGSGGGGSGAGADSGGQYQGDHVVIRFQEGDMNSGKIVRRVHSKVDVPPKVESGEMLFMHSLGARFFVKKDGSVHLYGKTSKQSDQSQQGIGGSGGSSGGSGDLGGSPLKNPPPLQPQTYKMKIDPKGVTTHSHFQQQQGGSQQQDPNDPTSTKSPPNYSTMETDPVNLKHTHTTYHQGQASQSSSGGGQAQPDTTQGDPAMDSANSSQPKMFSQTIHDTKKGQLQHTTYDTNGKMKHQVLMDNTGNALTTQTFDNGQMVHSVVMDNGKGTITTSTYKSGQLMAQTIHDNKGGHIAHKCKGVHSINAAAGVAISGNVSVNGSVQAASMFAAAGSVPGPDATGGSPGSVGSSPIAGNV